MKAIRYYRYGSPGVLEVADVEMPALKDNEVLIRVLAASLNPLDFHLMRGMPYLVRLSSGLSRPKAHGLGADMAGIIHAVGRGVTSFRAGEEVFGGGSETLAEYITCQQDGVVLTKPANMTFEQAASVPVAGFTALQALRDRGRVRPGNKVLVNGAGGGVGTLAVQIAKALGAEVTGVCSTAKLELVSSIGADHVVDYTQQDFTRTGQRYDVLIDMAGNRSLSELRRILAPKGVLVAVGASAVGSWIGPLIEPVKILALAPWVSQKLAPFLARQNRDDLAALRDMLESGTVTPVIDRVYPLNRTAEAVGYLEAGHASGKVVITI